MPRKLLKRWSPDPVKLRNNRSLRFLGSFLHDPNLFHLTRHSVSTAFATGLFVAFLPIPGHVPLVALLAFWFRCNLPLSVALVWISNPLTFPFIVFSAYQVGVMILDLPYVAFSFELKLEWFTTEFLRIWKPLLLGSLIFSIFFSCTGYLIIQGLWRWTVVKKWKSRPKNSNPS